MLPGQHVAKYKFIMSRNSKFGFNLCVLNLVHGCDIYYSTNAWSAHTNFGVTNFVMLCSKIVRLTKGQWWWEGSSVQHAYLLLGRSEFESRWSLQFFCKIFAEKKEYKQKEAWVGPFFRKIDKKDRMLSKSSLLCHKCIPITTTGKQFWMKWLKIRSKKFFPEAKCFVKLISKFFLQKDRTQFYQRNCVFWDQNWAKFGWTWILGFFSSVKKINKIKTNIDVEFDWKILLWTLFDDQCDQIKIAKCL